MRRRTFIALMGGGAGAWSLPAQAQQTAVPVIGFLRNTAPAGSTDLVVAFRQGLNEAGFTEGQNVAIEYRWAENQHDRLEELAADLVRRRVSVIVANAISAQAAMTATAVTPIVFVAGLDPVRTGLVASLNRSRGNVTGVVFGTIALAAKRLELLHELVPKASAIAVLVDLNLPDPETELSDAKEAGLALGRQVLIVEVSNEREINAAFARMSQAGVGALLVGSGAFFLAQRRQLVALAARYGLPANYVTRQYAEAGGLMSYGPSQTDAYRRAGTYAGRILKGTKPADLPIELPTQFELVINLTAAKVLGLEVPPSLLARADELIE